MCVSLGFDGHLGMLKCRCVELLPLLLPSVTNEEETETVSVHTHLQSISNQWEPFAFVYVESG